MAKKKGKIVVVDPKPSNVENYIGASSMTPNRKEAEVLTPKVSTEIIKMAKKKGKIVVVDPKPSNVENYIGASSMTPNRKEAELCLGNSRKKSIDEIGKEIREKIELENLLMTRSEEGVSLYEENRKRDKRKN